MSSYRITDGAVAGYPTKTLVSGTGAIEATFCPGVGMVGCSLTHRGEELLELRGGLTRYAEQGSTMGIPLLHPWANRLSGFQYAIAGRTVSLNPNSPLLHLDANKLPMHGVLPARLGWDVLMERATEHGAEISARLDFGADAELVAVFPFPHELRKRIHLHGSTLTITTTLTPTADVTVPVSFGYHPYLRLPGIGRTDWFVSLPVHRRLVLDERNIPTGVSEAVTITPGLLGDRSFDAGLCDLDDPGCFVLAGGGRGIEVMFAEGYPFAQVYAPAGEAFICFEPMTAPANALISGGPALRLLAPGESHTATFTITVRRAD